MDQTTKDEHPKMLVEVSNNEKEEMTEVRRRPLGSKYPGKTERRTFTFTPVALSKLDNRQGEFRFLSISDTVEQLIREYL